MLVKQFFPALQHHPAVISECFTLGSESMLLTSVLELQETAESLCFAPISEEM